jgi:lipoprotein-anchoring transpeptidase ErfK/SrfK
MRLDVTLGAATAALFLAGPLAAEPAAVDGTYVAATTIQESKAASIAAEAPPVPVLKPATEGAEVAAVSPATVPTVVAKPALPTLTVSINLSSQTMTVSEHGKEKHVWKISSGRRGYYTPTGTYQPQWMTRMHYSRKYDNAPMPYSVFFHNGFAIHATYATGALGQPASHGCIRLSPSNAKKFYYMVGKHGGALTRISISGSTPSYVAERKQTRRKTYAATGWWGGSFWAPANPKPQYYKAPRKPKYRKYKPSFVWPGNY